MQIFILSAKDLEGLLMRSEVVLLLLKCVLFSDLYTGLWQSLDEALCEGLIRTWKTMFGKLMGIRQSFLGHLKRNYLLIYLVSVFVNALR